MAAIRNKALGFLARREHSATELQRKLRSRDFDEASIISVIQSLQKEGLQSDKRFLENYMHNRVEKGYGPLRIKLELRERGISDDLIDGCIDMNDPAWIQQASRVRNKRFGNKLPGNLKEKARQSRFLNYRGFSGDLIRKVLNAGDE